MNSRAWTSLACIAAALAIASADTAASAADNAPAVQTFTVSEPTTSVRYTGTIVAEDETSLAFEISGDVQDVNVDVDTVVAKGDALASLDGAEVRQTISAAQAALQKANDDVAAAESNLSRMKMLVDQGLEKQAVVDEAEAVLAQAVAAAERAKKAAAAAEDLPAKITLLAPFDAVVVARNVEPFKAVSAGDTAFVLDPFAGFRAAFNLTESQARTLTIGMTVDVDIVTPPGGSQGTLTALAPVSQGASQWQGKASLTHPPKTLRNGQAVVVTASAPQSSGGDAYRVPAGAVASDSSGAFVFLVVGKPTVVRRTPVVAGDPSNGFVAVSEGLAPGDVVVVDPSGLSDGQAVTANGG